MIVLSYEGSRRMDRQSRISDTVTILPDGTTSVDVSKLLEKDHVQKTFRSLRARIGEKAKAKIRFRSRSDEHPTHSQVSTDG